ncbi:hypothetical protein BC835DRAFT_1395385 [Cytidiella melzeri]|nr:hypothetical protein BC835DRAFT_1395385 [Cytidiella melzeri]
MKLKNIDCEIICDDAPLSEYAEKPEGEKGMSCYVASEVGKRFILKMEIGVSPIASKFWIDGQCVDECVHTKKCCLVSGARVSATEMRPFIFSAIKLTDDDSFHMKPAGVNDLGSLCLKVYRVTNVQQTNSHYLGRKHMLEDEAVHEKAKKAGGHRVVLGETEETKICRLTTVSYIDPLDSPYVTFTWRYRSKDLLQAQGIVPLDMPQPSAAPKRPASTPPVDGPSKRRHKAKPTDEIDLTQDSSSTIKAEGKLDVKALRAKRDALDEQLRKAEAQDMKREASPIVLRGGGDEIIDLTGD